MGRSSTPEVRELGRTEQKFAPGIGIYKRLFARYYDSILAEYEAYIAPRKRRLFADLTGTVVEIGPGTGANLDFMPAGCRWIGIEPNPYMHASLLKRADAAGVEADLRRGGAQGIDAEAASADVAVSTLVLCSVPDQRRALAELRRVLKPGGRFLFIEHVAAETRTLRCVQWLMRPAWYAFGDGCRTNRDTAGAIRSAGFSKVTIEAFRAPSPPMPPWVAPHIVGVALR
jgi:SAM-dependent methyltransferase